MTSTRALRLGSLLLLMLASTLRAAAGPQIITSYSNFSDWLPIVSLAVMVSVMINAVYYMLGFFLNNRRIRSRATSELGQSLGTAIVVVVIVSILLFIGSGVFAEVPTTSPAALEQLCGNGLLPPGFAGTPNPPTGLAVSKIDFLNSAGNPPFGNAPSPTATICTEIGNMIGNYPAPMSTTDGIDYGLFATYLILANTTNQSLVNFNAFYNYEGWLGFQSKFKSITQLCYNPTCAIPFIPRGVSVVFKFSPLAGFVNLQKTLDQPATVQAALTLYMFFIQLVSILLILYLWPWALAAGIVLRTSAFTRRAGGLMIALVIAWLIVLPLVTILEYNASAGANIKPIGASALPTLPVYTQPPGDNVPPSVYGTPVPNVGGYVPASEYPYASCLDPKTPLSEQYVYESVCGYQGTATSITAPVGECTTDPYSSLQQCPHAGYTDAAAAGLTCPGGLTYAFENKCGDTTTFTGQCTGGTPQYLCDNGGMTVPQPIDINFFVLPKLPDALRYYKCLPDNLPSDEAAFANTYLIPFYGATTGGIGLVGGLYSDLPPNPSDPGAWLSFLPSNFRCNRDNALNSAMAIYNIYGIVGVTSFIIPIINLIIAISSGIGISSLLGGDTDIIGLSKLL